MALRMELELFAGIGQTIRNTYGGVAIPVGDPQNDQ
jgi:hypothetical protein